MDAIRSVHRELLHPLTITGLRRVLAQEGIAVLRRPIRNVAYVEGALGTFVIVLRSGLAPRLERRALAHEFAHIVLHFPDADEVVFQTTPCRREDPREIEAQLFVRLLELGPTATPDHPTIARMVAALDGPAIAAPLPPQLPLALPHSTADATSAFRERLGQAFEDSLAYGEQKRQRRGTPAPAHRPAPRRANDDFDRLGYDSAQRMPWFRDVTDRRWWLCDFARHGKHDWQRVTDYMQPGITHRLFESDAGDRRVYVFRDTRESRIHRAKHLDRQLMQAHRLPNRRIRDAVRERTARSRAE